MRTRIAAAVTGVTLAVAALVGTAVASPDQDRTKDEVEGLNKEAICKVLEEAGLIDVPELADLVERLGCKDEEPTETTTSTTGAPPGRGVR